MKHFKIALSVVYFGCQTVNLYLPRHKSFGLKLPVEVVDFILVYLKKWVLVSLVVPWEVLAQQRSKTKSGVLT